MTIYRLLLRLFPASFRVEYGEEMCAVFVARRRDENALVLWTGTIVDVVTNAIRVHADLLQQDLGWTLRLLRQAPGFTFTAVSVAALGIGANTAAFTLLDHVLLRPLPFPGPGRLVLLYQDESARGYPRIEISAPNLVDWRARNKSFEPMGAYAAINISVNLSGQGDPQRLDGAAIDSAVSTTLGVRPTIGRGFTAEDDRDGAANVVLLSHNLWTTVFGGDARALGRTVRLNEQTHTIIGVMPAGFAFPSRAAQLWIPLRFTPDLLSLRRNNILSAVARLRPGVSIDQARADLNLIARQLERAYPKDNQGVGAAIVEMRNAISAESRMMVIAVFGAAFCVMLIACTNLASLLLARTMVRRREIAVRMAIGAGRERLLRQLFTENLVLAVAGGIVGFLLAAIAIPTLALLVPAALPVSGVPQIDPRVFAFAAILTIVTSVAFGVGPALRASGQADMNVLRGRSDAGARSRRLRTGLVLVEVAATVALLVGAGLLVKALWRVQAVDPGFHARNVLTMRTALPSQRYSAAARRAEFYSHVLTAARALPGVTSAAYITALPMVFGAGIFPVTAPGISQDSGSEVTGSLRFVTPDYFATLGIPLRRGRDVSDRDDGNAPLVAVVSESLARRFWPGQDPIGRQLTILLSRGRHDRTVVGVVGDVTMRGLERTSEPQIYMPSDQIVGVGLFYAPKDLVIHTSGNPSALVPALRRIIHKADPELAVSDVQLLEEIVTSQTATRRTQLRLLGSFAAIAFLLAAVGIHGLLSFAVSTRTREVGVRLALGATPGDILSMFLRQGLVLGVAGVAVAVPLAYAGARGMAALLFGVQPGDPLIYTSAALVALVMTLAGSLRPALRASIIDPAVTIRTD